MLELSFVRAHPEKVRRALENRGLPGELLEDFLRRDEERRRAITEVESLKAERNRANAEIGRLKKEGGDATAVLEKMKDVSARIKGLDQRAGELDAEIQQRLLEIPNLLHETVPVGKSPADNAEVRRWGEPRRFDFEPKAHWDLGVELGLLDFERASKVAGARFVVYAGVGAQ